MSENETIKLANQGDAESQFKIGFESYMGVHLIHGKKLGVDYVKARDWLSKAAEQNHAQALYYMGQLYQNGYGVDVDFKKAISFFEKSSKHKFGPASVYLGFYYNDDKHVELNTEKAFDFFDIASEQGEIAGNFYKGKLLMSGSLDVGVDIESAVKCFTIAAENDFPAAQYELGTIYANGNYKLQNYKKAIHWLNKAAIKDNQLAQNKIALMYYEGKGVDKNYSSALGWWRRAAEPLNGAKPSVEAQLNCGLLYFNGQGVEKNKQRAEDYLLRAAKKGLSKAQFVLGLLYETNSIWVHSHAWFNIASLAKYDGATSARDKIEKKMSTQEVNEAQKLAEEIKISKS